MVGRAAIDVQLEEVRSGLDRVDPADLASEVAAGALVIDTRPIEQRRRDGELPGALIIDRNVLEWRLDPSCPYYIAEAHSANLRMISGELTRWPRPCGRAVVDEWAGFGRAAVAA
jgi:hypothetical protein